MTNKFENSHETQSQTLNTTHTTVPGTNTQLRALKRKELIICRHYRACSSLAGSDPKTEKKGEISGRRLVREWNPETGLKRSWHETIDNFGRIRQVRQQNVLNKTHYRFNEGGDYIGKW